MTNDQIPMTNEKDNDQFINNQLNKGQGGTDCLHRFFLGYWLLSVFLVIGIWLLVIFHDMVCMFTSKYSGEPCAEEETSRTQYCPSRVSVLRYLSRAFSL
jgi:hypothetical protein